MNYFGQIYKDIKFIRFINRIVHKRGMNKKVILQNDSPILDVHEDLPLSSVLLHANTVIEVDNQIDN